MTKFPPIAISTGGLWRLRLVDAFATAKAAGADGLELLVTQDPATQSPVALAGLVAEFELPIVAVHAPQLLLTRRAFTTDPITKAKRTIDLAAELGAGVVVLHPPYLWQLKYWLWTQHEFAEAAAKSTALVCMENMYPVNLASRKVGFHRFGELEALSRFDHLTLDTSHLAVAGLNIVESYQLLEEKVAHIHLSDNRGKGRDSHAPIGEGILPIADFIKALRPERLKSITLEINPGPHGEDRSGIEQILAASVQFVRDTLPVAGRLD